MDTLQGDILFVGDGDFSFTVAYAKKLLSDGNALNIRTSTLLAKEDLFGLHKNAQDNFDILTELGVEVLFGVDATNLQKTSNLQGLLVDAVVFSFPHTGGKSNIKRNRLLLRDFFDSVRNIVRPGGQVVVTLCRGQGGTPKDQPVRLWKDSWQALAQAATSGWVAVSIQPFNIQHYPQYSCTGFRSMDRKFLTADSLSHVFMRAPEFFVQPNERQTIGDGVEVSSFLARQLNQSKSVCQLQRHPLNLVIRRLNELLRWEFPSVFCKNLLEQFSPEYLEDSLMPDVKQICEEDDRLCLAEFQDVKKIESVIDEMTEQEGNCDLSREAVALAYANTQLYKNRRWESHCNIWSTDSCTSQTELKLIGTLLESPLSVLAELENVSSEDYDNCVNDLFNRTQILAAIGRVFRRSFLDSTQRPHIVAHEMVLIFPLPCTAYDTSPEVKSVLIQAFRSRVKQCLTGLLRDETQLNSTQLNEENAFYGVNKYLTECELLSYTYHSTNFFSTSSCNKVEARGNADPSISERYRNRTVKRNVAYIGTLNPKLLNAVQSHSPRDYLCAVLDLDSLTLARYDMPDYRLILSENGRLLSQFEQVKPEDLDYVYRPLSWHPPMWRHDLSFWEKPGITVDEAALVDVITNMAGETLQQLIFMNAWRDPETRLISRCFRLIFQSHDRPLCYATAHALQTAIRLQVADTLGVTLR